MFIMIDRPVLFVNVGEEEGSEKVPYRHFHRQIGAQLITILIIKHVLNKYINHKCYKVIKKIIPFSDPYVYSADSV